MAKPELGTKRQCLNCGAKYYDLSKDPIVCPKCGTVFEIAMPKGRPEAVAAKPEEDEVELEQGAETVSLDEVEAEEEEVVVAGDEDVDLGDDSDDDTFLADEDEDGDDDVTGLIDGDIEDDEEA